MATTYDTMPPLEEILHGASLVVIARLGEVVEREKDEGDRMIVVRQAHLEEVLAGSRRRKQILVRTVSTGEPEETDEPVLLILTPDYGQGRDEQYVPYFVGPVPVRRHAVQIGDAKAVSLDTVRKVLDEVAARRKSEERDLAREEKGEDTDAPYPEVEELGVERGESFTQATAAEPRHPDET